jgi:hypothetical protein
MSNYTNESTDNQRQSETVETTVFENTPEHEGEFIERDNKREWRRETDTYRRYRQIEFSPVFNGE